MIIRVSNHLFLGSKNSMKLSMKLPGVCNFKEIRHGIPYGRHFRVLSMIFILVGLEQQP